MTDNRLFLHVGTHKTGTTSFQASLGKNRWRLRRQGYTPVSLPEKGLRRLRRWRRYNVSELPHSMLRDGVATVGRLYRKQYVSDPAERVAVSDIILKQIVRSRAPNIILSAEAFAFLRTPEEAELVHDFLVATGREVTIVVAWREVDGWQASWRAHIQKVPANARRNARRDDAQRADGAWYFDKPAIRAFWAEIGPLREVDYDAALQSEGNVIPAIFRAMDVDPAGFAMDITRNRRGPRG